MIILIALRGEGGIKGAKGDQSVGVKEAHIFGA